MKNKLTLFFHIILIMYFLNITLYKILIIKRYKTSFKKNIEKIFVFYI